MNSSPDQHMATEQENRKIDEKRLIKGEILDGKTSERELFFLGVILEEPHPQYNNKTYSIERFKKEANHYLI